MPRLFTLILFLAALAGLRAAVLPVTPYTVIARVDSYEHYSAFGGAVRFSLAMPYGNSDTIVATILQPAMLAGREIAIPFESRKDGRELLVQKGTVFRFESRTNLAYLRDQTDRVYRRPIEFPELGVIVLKPSGEVAEVYEGVLNSRMAFTFPAAAKR